MKKFLFPIVLVLIFAVNIAAQAAKLDVGSTAPAMKVSKWVKGTPVTTFTKGKVYVVEFWATWCGPCRQTIPHLTELAKKYKGKVVFNGINVWDSNDVKTQAQYVAKISKFVKEQGNNMGYSVGLDDMKGTMAKTWMSAAEAQGIPTAFVIGKDRKIAAIVHPMALDQILSQIVNDKFDSKAYKQKRVDEEKAQKAVEPIYNLLNQGKHKEALESIDKTLAANPEYEEQLGFPRLYSLMNVDEQQGTAYAQKLADGVYKDEPLALSAMASLMISDEVKAQNAPLAVTFAEKANAISQGKDINVLVTLGSVHFKAGNIDKAIEYQQTAVDLIAKQEKIDPGFKQKATEDLQKYKDSKK